MNELTPKISIIGCGNVGIRYAYALILKSIARQIVLLDINKNKAKGEEMDLSHAVPYTSPVEILAGDYKDIAGSDLVVITAGKGQKPGQTRIELARDNVKIFKKIIPEVIKYEPDAAILIVSNPVDILSYAAYKISEKSSKKIIGSGTVLDTARLRYELSNHCKVDARNIHAYILGEHGDSEFAVWSRAMIGGVLLDDYCPVCERRSICSREKDLNEIFARVRDSAYKIIEKKGETSYGIGAALVRITKAIINNENSVLPVSLFVDDYLGVDDVYLSLPAIINKDGIRQALKLRLNQEEEEAFRQSSNKLKKIIKEIGL